MLEPVVNTTEIMAWRWIAPDQLTTELEIQGERYTPWFKLEWQRPRGEFAATIAPDATP